MTCFFCKGDMNADVTPHMIELPNCILIVKNVPCHRCTQCGEVTFGSDVVEQLDALSEQFASSMTEVAVVNFSRQTA